MSLSKRARYQILARDGYTCRYCGASAPDVKLEVDHVIPRADGGSDDPENLVTACEDCNRGKGKTHPPTIKPVPIIVPVPVEYRVEKEVPAAEPMPVQEEPKAPPPAEPAPAKPPRHPLIGCAFVSYSPDGRLNWQGEVINVVGETVTVELYSWMTGDANGTARVPLKDFAVGAPDGSKYQVFSDYRARNAFLDRYGKELAA